MNKSSQVKQYAIYTAIIGDYDDLLQPMVIDDRFDYILFSNEIQEAHWGVWQVRPVPYSNCIHTKTARWVKTHPEILLPEYVSSLWIDASISIASQQIYDRFLAIESSPNIIASIPHPNRHCVYGEMLAVISHGFECEKTALAWGHHLRREGYPRKNGLFETGMLYRKHCPEMAAVDALWWQCINKYSRRDQLSFDYCLWKHGIKCISFLNDNTTVWNSDLVHYNPLHKNIQHRKMLTKRKEGWIARWSSHSTGRTQRAVDLYYHICGLPCPTIAATIIGQYLRLTDIVKRFLCKRTENA